VISFIPSLHQVANFSWFIGVALAASCYWLVAREKQVAGKHTTIPSGAVAMQKD